MGGSSREYPMRMRVDDVLGLVHVLAAEPGRHIPVPGTLNFRDTGGLPVAGGRATGWRRLFRSDGLRRLDSRASGLLTGLGLRTVVDLRTSYEAEIAPSPLDDLAAAGALTMHISLIGEDLAAIPAELGEIYDYVIDRQGRAIADAVRCLARPGGLPALVHCTAGKDRTGIVVALTLAAVGVPDQIVAADYALTSLYLDPAHTPAIGQVREDSGLGEQLTTELLASPPELMLRTLDRARAQAGSIAGYLVSHGVSEAELDVLREALVTSQDGTWAAGSDVPRRA